MRNRMAFLTVLLALMVTFGLAKPGYAQSASDAFTLQPGGSATITFDSFCLDYGLLFPTSVGLPQANAVDPGVVGALNYAISKGYTSSQTEQTQLAIWTARGAPGVPALEAAGQEIAANLGSAPVVPAGATSVIDAAAANQVKVTLQSFGPTSARLSFIDDAFQGQGQLLVENTSGSAVTLYMPVGTYFPASAGGYQNMIGYAAGIQVTNPQQAPTNTTAPTNTPEAPTNTPAPATSTPIAATATPGPTFTPAPTETPAATETPVPAGTTVVPTGTVAPTSTSGAPTVTPAAPVAPTATGAAAGSGFEITPTSQPAPAGGGQQMPDTGVPLKEFSTSQIISAIVLGLDVLLLGFVLQRRARRK